ncbi:MAG: LacI family DNA-binding transcriptional regulator [Balneolaceae bacterium]
MKNVRLEDIANRLSLTKVSISKALRDHPDISVETRKKVKKMAKKMGYRPNLQARSLTSKKTRTIGVIIPKIAHSFFSLVMEGIYKRAQEKGYKVILGISMENEDLERQHIESMMEMRVDGLLVSISEHTKNAEIFDQVKEMGIHLVFFDRGFMEAGYSYIKVADREGAKSGVREMIDLGYRDIAHLSGFSSVLIGRDRKRGYEEAMKEAGLKIPESSVVEGGFGEEDGYEGFKKLLEQRDLPEALFAVTYPVGLGALRYMIENGIDPKEIKILTFGGNEFIWSLVTPFICIDQPTVELGKRAIEQLLLEMESEEDEVEPKLIELPASTIKS